MLKTEIIDRFDPDHAYLQQAIRTALAALIAVIIFRYKPEWTQAYWIILAAAFLMQTRLGHTQWQQMLTLTICGACAALCAWFATVLAPHTLLLAGFLACTTFVTIYLSSQGHHHAIAGFFINLFAIMSAGIPLNTTNYAERPLMILLGAAIALLMTSLWPTHTKSKLQKSLKVYLNCLAEFCVLLSNSYLHDEYFTKTATFEEKLHERRNRALRLLNNLRQACQLPLSKQPELIHLAEYLHASIISLGNIRHRLTQDIELSGYADSLSFIHQDIAQALRQLAKGTSPDKLIHLRQIIASLQNETKKQATRLPALSAFLHTAEQLADKLNNTSSVFILEPKNIV